MGIWRLLIAMLVSMAVGMTTTGCLKVQVTTVACTKLDCGGRTVEWLFELTEPAPCDGYFVQQVNMSVDERQCNVELPPNPNPTVTVFWEAWAVRQGDTKETQAAAFTYTDRSNRPTMRQSQGTALTRGTIKFFCRTKTGDLGDLGVAPADTAITWGPGRVPLSGQQPSTSDQPTWWNDEPDADPGERLAESTWVCCPPQPVINELRVEPNCP